MSDDKKRPELNLDAIKKDSDWGTLADINTDTLLDITKHIALVVELRTKSEDRITPEIDKEFDGLIKTFKDLIRETLATGLKHSSETQEITTPNKEVITYPKNFFNGEIKSDDDAMTYLNAASSYMNIQDKTISIISLGWVDIFTKLKIPTDDLNASIQDGMALAKEITDEK